MLAADVRRRGRLRGRGVVLLVTGFRRLGAGLPRQQPSTVAALTASAGIALAGAVLWGLVAMVFRTQLPLIGLLIGGGVGVVVAHFRGAHWPTMAAGAVIAVAGCALGTLLAIVFVLLRSGIGLSFVLGHFGGPLGVLHYYPSSVGVLGLVFWAVAAFAAIRIPLRRS
jgi:hypothetical protein